MMKRCKNRYADWHGTWIRTGSRWWVSLCFWCGERRYYRVVRPGILQPLMPHA